MSFNFVKKLPTPAEIREQYPVSDAIIQVKERDGMDDPQGIYRRE